jgi:exonuclease III
LAGKLKDPDFISYVSKFDIVCLQETFLETVASDAVSGYVCFSTPATQLSNGGRRSGGVAVLVKSSISHLVEKLDTDLENIVALLVSKKLFDLPTDVILLGVYVPPIDSPFYDIARYDCGIAAVELCLEGIEKRLGQVPLFICGDHRSWWQTGNPGLT